MTIDEFIEARIAEEILDLQARRDAQGDGIRADAERARRDNLLRVQAKRQRLLEICRQRSPTGSAELEVGFALVLSATASLWCDHPDFQPEWATTSGKVTG